MPILFTKEEVRDFLSEQGFDVTNDSTLNRFVKDLKKVVKYESLRRRRQRLGHEADDTSLDSSAGTGRSEESPSTSTSNTTGSSSIGGLKIKVSPTRPEENNNIINNNTPSFYTHISPIQFVGSDTDEDDRSDISSSSYYDEDDLPPPPLTAPVPSRKPATPKNEKKASGGNKLIMKRITAATNETGDSIIEESDIDLGRKRLTNQLYTSKRIVPPPQPPSSTARIVTRPRTAPARGPPSGPATRPASVAVVASRNVGKTVRQPPSRPLSARSGIPVSVTRSVSRQKYSVPSEPQRKPQAKKLGRQSDELLYILNKFIDEDEDDSESLQSEGSETKKKMARPPPHIARDPVLLYHWYKKNHWDMHSIPGEDRHMQLRWNIRAKTVGGRAR